MTAEPVSAKNAPPRLHRRGAGILLSAILLTACQGTGSKHTWTEGEVSSVSEKVLWEVTAMALSKQGFPVGAGLDPRSLVATSGWRISLHPFRNQGYREQAEVHFERTAPETYSIRIRVAHQKNADIIRPLDPSFARWENATDNEEEAQILLHLIRAFLGTDDLRTSSPEGTSKGGHGA